MSRKTVSDVIKQVESNFPNCSVIPVSCKKESTIRRTCRVVMSTQDFDTYFDLRNFDVYTVSRDSRFLFKVIDNQSKWRDYILVYCVITCILCLISLIINLNS